MGDRPFHQDSRPTAAGGGHKQIYSVTTLQNELTRTGFGRHAERASGRFQTALGTPNLDVVPNTFPFELISHQRSGALQSADEIHF